MKPQSEDVKPISRKFKNIEWHFIQDCAPGWEYTIVKFRWNLFLILSTASPGMHNKLQKQVSYPRLTESSKLNCGLAESSKQSTLIA